MQEEKKPRIKHWMFWALCIAAGSIDLIELVLDLFVIGEVVSPFISVGADFLFWLWFKILGVSFAKKPDVLGAWIAQAIVGLIPAVDALPELTVAVVLTARSIMKEDGNWIFG